jgi:hypothetical protein
VHQDDRLPSPTGKSAMSSIKATFLLVLPFPRESVFRMFEKTADTTDTADCHLGECSGMPVMCAARVSRQAV